MKVTSAEFLKSAAKEKDFPTGGLPEVAFAGRSNVGKSSLINALLNRRKLARTSSRPGCTRVLNFYCINNRLFFVDLPGYGFAEVPLAVRRQWKPMVDAYLEGRNTLRLVILILDVRRNPHEDEASFLRWLEERSIPVLVVLTKSDKISKSVRMKRKQAIEESLSLNREEILLFSARTGEGKVGIWKRINSTLSGF
jgi:GTP-binding protein